MPLSIKAVERYHDARADAVAEADEAVDANMETFIKRINELMLKPSERDAEIWGEEFDERDVGDEYFDLSVVELFNAEEENPEDYKEIRAAKEAFGYAAKAQAYVEHLLIPLIQSLQDSTSRTFDAARTLGPEGVKKAGTAGNGRYEAAKERVRAKRQNTDTTTTG